MNVPRSETDDRPWVRSFSSEIRREHQAEARQIIEEELVPALIEACPACTVEVLVEVAPAEQETVTAVIWTRWRSLDELHEAMNADAVGEALIRLLLFAKDPVVTTFERDVLVEGKPEVGR